jgi:serine/threonine-protein kinase
MASFHELPQQRMGGVSTASPRRSPDRAANPYTPQSVTSLFNRLNLVVSMSLSPGDRLGPYEIIAPLGAGGMGEVYRAKDVKLKREAALKVLPDSVADNFERLARFQREAEVLAALNHPNIASIYGIEEGALVMELVEGETLKGPLPVETALDYARQIADALEAAHEKGIVHRDLKPANVKVTPAGVVKVLDFGLATVLPSSTSDASDPTKSPTLTLHATGQRVIMGTAAYMSPEQANGKPLDKRSDVWSFGVVLFEMLSGQRLFQGETVLQTLANVLHAPIELDKLPQDTPLKVRDLLRECLERNVKNRLHDIGDARIVIEEALRGTSQQLTLPLAAPRQSKRMFAAAAAAIGLVLIALGVWWGRPAHPAERPLMQLAVDLGPDAVGGPFITAAISPDGMRLVFPAKSPDGKIMLATRLLSDTKRVLLPGTEGGRDPFFSPDGSWIGFFADRKMKKISVRGGAPVALSDASDARGADWGADGNIVAALNTQGALSLVSSDGGAPQPVTRLQGSGLSHRWPQFLPGTDAVLFTVSSSTVAFEDSNIVVASLKTGEIKTLVRGGYFGRYLATGDRTGHLVYVHEGVLFGVPFDPARKELRGTPVPLLDDLAADPNSGAGQFTFSASGTLLYRTGKVSAQNWPVSWLDNSGKIEPLIATPALYFHPRFSPDGQRLAVVQGAGNDARVVVYDWQRETMSRLASSIQQPVYPTWTPDGKHLAFGFRSADGFGLGWTRADGAGEVHHLLSSNGVMNPFSFFPDGKRLAYYESDPVGSYDLWTVALDISDPDHPKAGKPEPFLRTPANERHPAVSPDGRWIAYSSDESGTSEVYVRPFPGPGGKWQISNTGGQLPVWSRNGRELFFQNLDHRIMIADYDAKNGSLVVGKPRLWSNSRLHYPSALNYDLAPDGKRFAILSETEAAEEQGAGHMAFLLNFFDELRRRIPEGK